MNMTPAMLKTLADVQEAIGAAFRDYSLDTNIEIQDDNGFMEMCVEVEFYGGVSALISFNLETGRLIIGEDLEEAIDDAAVWRQLAFALARQIV